ncbi:MAG: hypothetical protein OXC19_25190, partial [Bryobacterales bacterium]|nr:hypothetical protein [Bryobacterales bacterium]
TATDTKRGYRGGLLIRRLVGVRWLTAELRDRGVRERCASTTTTFLSNEPGAPWTSPRRIGRTAPE